MRTAYALIAIAAVVSGCYFPSLSDKEYKTDERPTAIIASFAPIAGIARDVAGEDFEVDSLAPFTAGPQTFDPYADEKNNAARIARSDIFITSGLDADKTIDRFVRSEKPAIIHVELTADPTLKIMDWTPVEGERGADWRENPYFWLSIPNIIAASRKIESDLTRLLPDRGSRFRDNASRLAMRLNHLQNTTSGRLMLSPNRRVALMSPRLIYLTDDLGLDVSSVVPEKDYKNAIAALDSDAYRDIAEKLSADAVAALLIDKDVTLPDGFQMALRAFDIRIASVSSFETSNNLITAAGGFEGIMKQNHTSILNALRAPELGALALAPNTGGSLLKHIEMTDKGPTGASPALPARRPDAATPALVRQPSTTEPNLTVQPATAIKPADDLETISLTEPLTPRATSSLTRPIEPLPQTTPPAVIHDPFGQRTAIAVEGIYAPAAID